MSDPTTPTPYRVITFKADEVESAAWTAMMGFMFDKDPARLQAAAAALNSLYHNSFNSSEWVDPNAALPPVKPVDLSP